jgi:hypothetical protein
MARRIIPPLLDEQVTTIAFRPEWFWVIITAIVDNHLVHAKVWGVDLDDVVRFEVQNIIGIARC